MNACLQSIPLTRILGGSLCHNSKRKLAVLTGSFTGVEHISPSNFLAASTVQKWQCREAGHSKWSNIKDTKGSKDQARGRIFSIIATTIKMALKDGSTNPTANPKLAIALENARKNNMPKTTINNIIENSQKTMENAKEHFLEYRGLDGLCLYIQLYTDNMKRGKGYINAVVKKTGFSENKNTGSVRHMFDERGLIRTSAKMGDKLVTLSDAEEHAIEAGAEDVELQDDDLEFLCNPRELHKVRMSLEKYGYDIESSDIEFLPVSPVVLDDEGMDSLATIVGKIEDIEDVYKVYPNV